MSKRGWYRFGKAISFLIVVSICAIFGLKPMLDNIDLYMWQPSVMLTFCAAYFIFLFLEARCPDTDKKESGSQ